MRDLKELREDIDKIDKDIVRLFEERVKAAEAVADFKRANGKGILDAQREKEKIARVKELAHTDFNKLGVEALFSHLMSMSRMRQYMLIADRDNELGGFIKKEMPWGKDTKVVFQGVKGAYGQEAMEGYFGTDIDSFNEITFRGVMEAVSEGRAEYGVLPIENSSTGIITDVYDLLEEYDNYIVGEYVVAVKHALLGLPGATIDDIKTVYSHPQGLMQCKGFLDPMDWEKISLQNTAIAAKKVITEQKTSQAAIASKRAAAYHGLAVLKEEINDNKNNSTRFIIVKNKKEYVKDANKVSICFELPHESGTLYNILAHFIFNHLNMNRIESRPIKGRKWEYRFFIDFDGNLSDNEVKNAITGIAAETNNFRILGNYVEAADPEA